MWGGKRQEKRGGMKLTPPPVADATEREPLWSFRAWR